jgi:predicted secreted protein
MRLVVVFWITLYFVLPAPSALQTEASPQRTDSTVYGPQPYQPRLDQLVLQDPVHKAVMDELELRQQKASRAKTQKELRQDTGELYQLVTELKQSLDKDNENVLSVDTVKKAARIEKLAKSVHQKLLNL